MQTYIVNSGAIKDFEVKAISPRVAAMIAINENSNKALAEVIMVEEKGGHPDDDVLMLTTYVLEHMGFEVEGF